MRKCAIVTGGTRGIGYGVALAYAQAGYHLVITNNSDLSIEALNELKTAFIKYDVEVMIEKANVADYEACERVVKLAKDNFDSIDILVNNAGITKDNLILRMTSDDFKQVTDINLLGTFNMIKAISKTMIKQKYGRIINMSSVIGLVGNIGQANYAASKAGIIALSKSAALELASRNITVNCIAPGYITTQMSDVLSDKIKDEIKNKIPSKKLGNVDDVVNVAIFLASPQSSYITGQVINVCGGMVM